MKTTLKLLMVLVLALTTFMQHSSASAASTFKFRDEGAFAFFSSVDGCILTDVSIFASDSNSQTPPGPGSPSSGTGLFISQYNLCTGEQLLGAEGFAPLADPDFQISGRFESATLSATVSVFDYVSGNTFDVFVDLTWTGVGSLSREGFKFRSHLPGCKVHTRFRGTFRSAEVSGTVSDGTTNFTLEPGSGAISLTKGGDVVIGCN